MLRYIVRRVLWGIALLFITSAVVFVIFSYAQRNHSGGYAGPDLDFIKNPNGDPAVAKKYMQKAG